MSAAHFQFPSVCFSQTSRYFPRSLIGLPLASFIVNSYVPLTHAISPDLPIFTLVGCQLMTKPGLANMSFQTISNRLLRRCAGRVWREHDRIIRIESDCLLDIFSCCRFRPLPSRSRRSCSTGWVLLDFSEAKVMIARSKPARSGNVPRWRWEQQVVSRKTKRSACHAKDECRELATAPIRNDLVRRKILRSFQALRCHFKRPGNEQRHGESKREQYHECCDDRLWCVE